MNVPSTRKFSNASLLCIWLLGHWAALLSLVSILHYALQNRPGKPPERIFWEPRITRQLWERIATVLVLRGVPPSQYYTGRVFEVSQGFYHSPYGLILTGKLACTGTLILQGGSERIPHLRPKPGFKSLLGYLRLATETYRGYFL